MGLLRISRRQRGLVLRTLAAFAGILGLVYFVRRGEESAANSVFDTKANQGQGLHKLCVLVPFRDRFEELTDFVPRITAFLESQQVFHPDILVINQVDNFRFNRASLLNAGFLESQKHSDPCDYVALHDVDLVPKNTRIKYEYPESGPLHLAAPGLHPKYDYPDFLGGILLLTSRHMRALNGMSNRYWGWGLEDDEFHARIRDAGLTVRRPDPSEVGSGPKDTFEHNHAPRQRRRDNVKCHNQLEHTRLRDRSTGLDTTQYKVASKKAIVIDGHPMTLLNVRLWCGKEETPWCDCTGVTPDKPRKFARTKDSIMPVLPKRNKTQ